MSKRGHTLWDVYQAAKTERHFDYWFWSSVVFSIVIDYVHPLLGRLLVSTAAALIFTIGLSGFLIVLPTVAEPWTVWFNFNIVWGTFLLFSILFNYVSAVCTPPGTSSDAPGSDEPHPPHATQWDEDDNGRQCKKCQRPKPPRAHHCSVCKRCVLKMDHHCPWVNNCVGLNNYRFFYCFLLWTVVGTAYVAALLAPQMLLGPRPLLRTLHSFRHHRRTLLDAHPAAAAVPIVPGHSHRPLSTLQFAWNLLAALRAEPYVLVVTFALSSSIAFAVGLLLTLHTYLVVTAQTTIEFAMSLHIRGKLRSEGRRYFSPYDRGLATNLSMVFGYAAPWYVAVVVPRYFPPPPALPPVSPLSFRRPEIV